MSEKLNFQSTNESAELLEQKDELEQDPNINRVPVHEMGFTLSNRAPDIAESISPNGVEQRLRMLVEAGNQLFALTEVATESGKRTRVISLVGKEENDRAQLVHFFDSDKPNQTIAIGREFDARGLFGEDPMLSREHFAVSWDLDRIRVDDAESTNGTAVGVARRETLSAPDNDESVALRGLKRLLGRGKEASEPTTTPISEGLRWSIPSEEILEEMGETR